MAHRIALAWDSYAGAVGYRNAQQFASLLLQIKRKTPLLIKLK